MDCKSSARSLLRIIPHRNSSLALVACLGLAVALLSIGSKTLQIDPLNAVGTLGPTQWSLIGPGPISLVGAKEAGRVTALAVDPRNSDVVFLGGAEGGIWKTTDGGTTWTPLTDSQPSLSMGALALDPSNPDTVYGATGLAIEGKYGAGILKSTDSGSTWTNIPGPFVNQNMAALSVSPTNSQVLLATSPGNGIFRSTDAGQTWTNVFRGSFPIELFFDPTNGSIAYATLGVACCGTQKGVYKSLDGGLTWNPISGTGSNVLPSTNLGRIEIAISPSSPSTLYAGIANSTDGSLLGLFKTVDGGANWTALLGAPDYCNPQCGYDNVIRVHPTNPDIVVAGGIHIYRSLDGGNSWSDIRVGANGVRVHVDHHALAFSSDGSVLYVGNDGGCWRTTDLSGSVAWTNLNATLAITQFDPGLSVHPTNPAIAFAGGPDNGTSMFNGSLTWPQVVCLDGGWTALDPLTPSNVYASCGGTTIYKSSTGVASGTWKLENKGINGHDRTTILPVGAAPLVIDPSNPRTLYFGTYRVYQTTNGGSSWTLISPDLTNGSSTITAIAVANLNTDYVGTGNGLLWVTRNSHAGTAATWVNATGSLPNRTVAQIVVDRANPALAYALVSGFSGAAGHGHIFQTADAGGSWSDLTGSLPDIPSHDIIFDPDLSNTWYLATDSGVFSTGDGGTTWSTLGAGLPNVTVVSLGLFHPSRTLYAATHGRSAWTLQLPDFSLSIPSSSSASVTAGQSASYTLSITPVGGFNQTVWLTCSGMPPQSSWSLSPSSVTLNGSSPATATLTVSTPARSTAEPRRAGWHGPWLRAHPSWPLLVWVLALLLLVRLAWLYRPAGTDFRRARLRPLRVTLGAAILLLLMLAVMAGPGCGGGGSVTSPGASPTNPSPNPLSGTPAATYTLTMTAALGSGSGTLQHSVNLTLQVN
jgi:photosystem II stability/assembly factor-like uncharacterized protein